MNRFAYLTVVICLAMATHALAQQLPLFTQYRDYGAVINPAMLPVNYFPYEHNMVFGASYRTQWTELTGGPRTAVLNGSYLTTDFNPVNLLIGGHILHDVTGPIGNTGIYGRIGGVLSDDPYYGGIAVGLTAGLVQYRVKLSELRLRDEGDIVGMQDQSQLYPDVGLGVYAYKRLSGSLDESVVYAGLSVPQVLGLDLEFRDEDGTFNTKRVQHFYGTAGIYLMFDNDTYLEASTWGKYVEGAPFHMDFNLRYQLPYIWVGAGYATSQTLHLETGILIGEDVMYGSNHFRIGYGYSYNMTSFGPYVGPAHEINLAYSIGSGY